MKKILFLFGTRPEAIKMSPLIKTFKNETNFDVRVAVTAQHREMLDQVVNFFDIELDYDLNVMKPNQKLHHLTSILIDKITEEILEKESFDYVFVQGDTTTVLAGALASFYKKIKIIHIEAGLRSDNLYSPFPEEMNRVLTSKITDIHFCPTELSKENLEKEGITNNVFVVGNTVIDALYLGLNKVKSLNQDLFFEKFSNIDFNKKIILITCHRRENFGEPFEEICKAILAIANKNNDVEVIFPVHLNPNIQKNAHNLLIAKNVKLIDPLDYPDLIWMMDKSYFILTDSGGIQEEAPSLGKPVLVMRNVTERMEGIEAGNAILVGSEFDKITKNAQKLLDDKTFYSNFSKVSNPYGDGKTAEKIVETLNKLIDV